MNTIQAIRIATADHRDQAEHQLTDAEAVAEIREQLDETEVRTWNGDEGTLVADGLMTEETWNAYLTIVTADEAALAEVLAENDR
jgi:hypothetical protein